MWHTINNFSSNNHYSSFISNNSWLGCFSAWMLHDTKHAHHLLRLNLGATPLFDGCYTLLLRVRWKHVANERYSNTLQTLPTQTDDFAILVNKSHLKVGQRKLSATALWPVNLFDCAKILMPMLHFTKHGSNVVDGSLAKQKGICSTSEPFFS